MQIKWTRCPAAKVGSHPENSALDTRWILMASWSSSEASSASGQHTGDGHLWAVERQLSEAMRHEGHQISTAHRLLPRDQTPSAK